MNAVSSHTGLTRDAADPVPSAHAHGWAKRFTGWLMRLLPQHPDPCQETPEQAALRLRHLERSANVVRNKIGKVYALDWSMPNNVNLTPVIRELADGCLQEKSVRKLLPSDDVARKAVIRCIPQAFHDYFDIFTLYRAFSKAPDTHEGYERYDAAAARDQFYRIYANHRTNAVEARFIAAGMNPLDAHRLNGKVIRCAVDTGEAMIHSAVYIDPAQRNKNSDLGTIEQIDQLRHYWRNRVTDLQHQLEAEPRR